MQWKGEIVGIFLAAEKGARLSAASETRAVVGRGLEGDRYFERKGTYSAKPGGGREVTLIESEAIEAATRDYHIELSPDETRRNLVTRGAPLNHLVGRTFRVGEALLRGVRLCEPCDYLEGLTRPGLKKALIHRGGLRAEVVREGRIRVGDAIEEGGEAVSGPSGPEAR